MPLSDLQMTFINKSFSLLYNNLSFGRSNFAYAHRGEVYMFDLSRRTGTSVDTVCAFKDTAAIQTAHICSFDTYGILVVTSKAGIQFFDLASNRLLFASGNRGADESTLYRGVASVTLPIGKSFIAVGSSTGEIQLFECTKDSVSPSSTLRGTHRLPIADIAGGVTSDGRILFASADTEGKVAVWEFLEGRTFVEAISFDTGSSITSVRLYGSDIIASFTSGHIRVYAVGTGLLRVEWQAHSKWINAIDVNTKKGWLATAAEDGLLCVWKLMADSSAAGSSAGAAAAALSAASSGAAAAGEIRLLGAEPIKDGLLTGVAFCGDDLTQISTAAFDTEKIFTWRVSE